MNLIRRSGRRFNEFAGTDLDRLAGISDGIFAVGMTLLVLGLAVLPTWVSITLIFLVQLNYVIAPRIPILHRF